MTDDVEWPWQYEFPPFFTIQPNAATKEKQLEAWRRLVLNYHQSKKQYVLDMTEAQSSPLFHNKAINRQLTQEGIHIVLQDLHAKGSIEWLDKTQKRCLIYWRTPEEWGALIYNYISSNGLTNSVCTLFELASGDDTINEEFHGLHQEVLIRALKTLQTSRKAEVFEDNEGVKFF